MKRTYGKPEVNFVSFALTEAIASCGTLLYMNHTQETTCAMNPVFSGLINLTIDKQCEVYMEGYCYFTSSDMLMNS